MPIKNDVTGILSIARLSNYILPIYSSAIAGAAFESFSGLHWERGLGYGVLVCWLGGLVVWVLKLGCVLGILHFVWL